MARRERKAARLKHEAAADPRRPLQKKRLAEEAARKRERERSTMHSYFATSQNFEDCATLLDGRGGAQDQRGGVVGDGHAECLAAIDLLHLEDSKQGAAGKGEPDLTIELLIPPVVQVTSDSNAYLNSEDEPNTFVRKTVVLSEIEELDSDMSDFDLFDIEGQLSPARCGKRRRTEKEKKMGLEEVVAVGGKWWKKNYDLTKKYQMEWAAKAP